MTGALVFTVCADTRHVHLSEGSFSYAAELIEHRLISVDLRNAWGESNPSTEEENGFIRAHGIQEYAKWHLGIDESHAPNTKARYKFPYGDFRRIHRSALLAAKSRARQYGYADIENAANRLLEMIESKQKNQGVTDGGTERSASHAVKNASINSGNSSL